MKNGKINLLSIAFRNIGRHKVKTILTSTAIAIGIALYIWMDAWLLGMNLDSRRNLINYETGSVKIYSKEYFENKDELPMYDNFKNYQPVIDKLDKAGYNAAPHFVFTGSLLSQEQELPFIFVGIDPEKEKKVLNYYKYNEPPYRIEKNVFENQILPKIKINLSSSYFLSFFNKNPQNKNIEFIKSVYELNKVDSYYYLKKLVINNNKNILKNIKQITKHKTKINIINKELTYLENKNEGTNNVFLKKILKFLINAKSTQLENKKNKIEVLNQTNKSIINAKERQYLDKIKNIFVSIEYYDFVKNGQFEAFLGVKGAKDLNITIGDRIRASITIDIKDELGKIKHVNQLIELSVGGIINSPNPKTNGYIAYLPLDILQDEKGLMLDGKITEICIRKKGVELHQLPKKDESSENITKILGSTLPSDLVAVGWKKDAKDYLAMSAGDKVSTYITIGILFILAIVGIANTMLMAIFERTKEIGMMRAIGMKGSDIMRLFIFEAGFIGLIGSIFGIAFGLLLDYWIIYYGIDYTNIIEQANMQDFGYRIVGIFKGAWNFHTIIASPFVATLVAGITAILPAIKAVKMSIVDALRFE